MISTLKSEKWVIPTAIFRIIPSSNLETIVNHPIHTIGRRIKVYLLWNLLLLQLKLFLLRHYLPICLQRWHTLKWRARRFSQILLLLLSLRRFHLNQVIARLGLLWQASRCLLFYTNRLRFGLCFRSGLASLWSRIEALSTFELNVNIQPALLIYFPHLPRKPLLNLHTTFIHRWHPFQMSSSNIFSNLNNLPMLSIYKLLPTHSLHKLRLRLTKILWLKLDAFQKLLLLFYFFFFLQLSYP